MTPAPRRRPPPATARLCMPALVALLVAGCAACDQTVTPLYEPFAARAPAPPPGTVIHVPPVHMVFDVVKGGSFVWGSLDHKGDLHVTG